MPEPEQRPSETSKGAPDAIESARLQDSAWRWVRVAAVAIAIFVGYQLLLVFRSWLLAVLTIVLYVVFGAVLALLAAPAVQGLRMLRVPRTLAILSVLLGGLLALAGLGYLVSGPMNTEAHQLASRIPHLIAEGEHLFARVDPMLTSHGININPRSLANQGLGAVSAHLASILVRSITGLIGFLVNTVVVLFVTFWLLRDGQALRDGVGQWLPGRVRSAFDFGVDAIIVVVGGYVRAQIFMALLIGVLSGVGTALIGVPFPLIVALAAGVLELIPMVGPFAGGAVGVMLALSKSATLALETVAVFLIIHFIEGYIVGPRVQARFVRVHPLVAFLALLAGIESAGFLGALLAIPATSLLAVITRATVGDWRASRPDLFSLSRGDTYLEQSQRRLLREFRLFKTPPGPVLRRLMARVRARGDGPPDDPGGHRPDDGGNSKGTP